MTTVCIVGPSSARSLSDALRRALSGIPQLKIGEYVTLDSPQPLPTATAYLAILPKRLNEAASLVRKLLFESDVAERAAFLSVPHHSHILRTCGHLRLLAPGGTDLYLQLPLSRHRLRDLTQRLRRLEPGNVTRLREVVKAQSKPRQTTVAALDELASVPYGDDERLVDEHAILSVDPGAKRYRAAYSYQRTLDHYYLATNFPPAGEQRQTILVIDDRPGKIERELHTLAMATNTTFLVSQDWSSFLNSLTSSPRPIELTGSWSIIGPSGKASDVVGVPRRQDVDAVLVDLLFEGRKRGIEAIRVLTERWPEIPSFLLTWSEEPDVMAEAMRASGACGFVSKRRLLRLPYELNRFLYQEISPLLPHLADTSNGGSAQLRRRLIGLVRLWRAQPAILWHGEKTFHAVEHAIEHHLSVWQLANHLLAYTWNDIRNTGPKYTAEDLFRFLVSLWLHDIGCKGDSEHQSAPVVRACHAALTGRLIRADYELYGLTAEESEDIALLCEFHQSGTPFDKQSNVKPEMKKLFGTQVLCTDRPELAPWAALLRLLDQIDIQWRRVGSEAVLRSKLKTLKNDIRFYAQCKRTPEEQAYACWLRQQPDHMDKHSAVSSVRLHVAAAPPGSQGRLGKPIQWFLWPRYTYRTCSERARRHYGADGIADYVLKEWDETGQYVELLGLSLPSEPPPSHIGSSSAWVWGSQTATVGGCGE